MHYRLRRMSKFALRLSAVVDDAARAKLALCALTLVFILSVKVLMYSLLACVYNAP